MPSFIKKFRALSVGALGSIIVAIGQGLTGDLTWAAAMPLIFGGFTHLFVSPADKVGI